MIVVTLTWRVINFQALCSQTASRWRRFSVELPKLWRLLEIKSDLCPWKRLAQLKCFNHNSDVAHFVANCCYLQKYTKCNVTSVYTKLLGKISLFKEVTRVFWRHQRRRINRTMCPDVWSNQTNRHHEFTNRIKHQNTKIQSNWSVIQEAASVCKRQFYSWLYFSHQKHHNWGKPAIKLNLC